MILLTSDTHRAESTGTLNVGATCILTVRDDLPDTAGVADDA